jgi:Cu/Ag efflux pump CusA
MRFGFSQPIEGRINDMISGIKADLAIHVYGVSLERMMAVGAKMMDVLASLPGAADLKMIPRSGLPSINVEVDRAAVARYGINASDVLDAIEAIGGHVVGQVVEGQARYPLQVRFEETARQNLDQLRDISVAAPGGTLIPLVQLAHINLSEGPVAVWRDNLSRRITVAANVRGKDLGSFVAAAKSAISSQIELPWGWWLEWGGQYENLQRALESTDDPGSGRLDPDPGTALQHVFLDADGAAHFWQRPARRQRWNLCPPHPWPDLFDHGRCRVHHFVRCLRPERRRPGLRDQSPARVRSPPR